MTTRRIDVEIASRGLAPSREAARAAVLAGLVTVDGVVVTKAGAPVAEGATIEITAPRKYVSRGGEKLAGALDRFALDVHGVVALDVGASTGGFTDCLLQRGAASVTALDVGYGQLAWSLRIDPRVRVLERTNIRTVDPALLGGGYDVAVIDVSFVSLEKVLPHVLPLLGPSGRCLALVKPQFEAGKGRVGKKGVVRDPVIHREVLESVAAHVRSASWVVRGLTWSPVRGPEGNIEFWIWMERDGAETAQTPADVVGAAHEALGG
jgi:23S rRNA (cytidine1920-2'-O)/16S rRNA (cytidine1409-2'-O)-methyltransferase